MAGGHAIVIAATDARVKAVVAQTPIIEGKGAPRKAYAPTGELLQAEQKRARVGYLPGAGASGDVETRLALAEYRPFWYVEQIPQKTAALFVVAEEGPRTNNAVAASKLLKGATDVARIPGVTRLRIDAGQAFNTAANAAAEWFLNHL
jgi:hypothetical protein